MTADSDQYPPPFTPPPTIQDSGTRRAFGTGSQRDAAEGKGRYDLLPMAALRRVAVHFEAGAKKYDDRNWEKGQPLSVFWDSACRHWCKVLEGQTDEDHAAAAAWNVLCFIETRERIASGVLPSELDDLPRQTLHDAATATTTED